MKYSDLKEPIVRQVLLLLFVSFLAILSLLTTHRYMQKRVAFIRSLANNEQVKVELSYLTHERLQTVRSYFQNMSLVSTENELQSLTLKINHEIKGLEDILSVIEKGGVVTRSYNVHFADKELIVQNFVYQNYYKDRINLEVIEIRAKLVELQSYVSDFWKILAAGMQQDISSLEHGFHKGYYLEDLLSAYKALDPFFERLMENSYRIYFDADLEMQKLEEITLGVERTFHTRSLVIYIVVCGIIIALGWIVLRNIGKILLEQTRIQKALQSSNENLESTILDRTEELQKEVDVRQQGEIEQRRQADFLKTVIDSLDHPFYVIDIETYKVQMLNKVAYRLGPDNISFCYSLTHKRAEPCTGKDHPCPIKEIKRTNKPVIMEHIHYDHNGQEIYVEVHGYPIFDADGKLQQMIEYSLDITDKKLALMALAETNKNLEEIVQTRTRRLKEEVQQREKLQLVVEQNPNTIVITDLDGNIEYVNKQFEIVTGYSKEEAYGHNPRLLSSGLTPSETYVDMWKTLEKGEIWNGEFINRAKNGKTYIENVLVAPLKNDKGELTNYVAIKENITELKKAREAAEASNIAKSQFLSRMSHELRTPLHAINGFSQLLLRKNKKHTLDERQMDQVLQINTAGLHLLELINEILDLSRIESGRLSLTLEPVVVADIVKECIPLVTPLADKFGIHIDVDENIGRLPYIQADFTRFKQVLLNLLSNAIKYNRPGGSVSLIGKPEKKVLCLEVIDNGIGISNEQMKDLFVPFVRLGQDDSGIEGTGIGMTISKQLMGLMHGTLDAESETDVGSVFRLKLPLAKEGDVKSVLKHAKSTGQSEMGFEQNATFLYIEDNPSNIQLMKFIIEQWPQYSLVVRKNAEKGIKAAGMLKPDIIFMDLHLPGMTGQEAFTELQKNPETKDIPVIALSADALPATVEDCLKLGFVSYLTKPIEIESLRVEIEKCLQS